MASMLAGWCTMAPDYEGCAIRGMRQIRGLHIRTRDETHIGRCTQRVATKTQRWPPVAGNNHNMDTNRHQQLFTCTSAHMRAHARPHPSPAHTHTHTHTHIHTLTNRDAGMLLQECSQMNRARRHTSTQARKHAGAQARKHPRTQARKRARTPVRKHARTQYRKRARTHTGMKGRKDARRQGARKARRHMRVHPHACKHTHLQTETPKRAAGTTQTQAKLLTGGLAMGRTIILADSPRVSRHSCPRLDSPHPSAGWGPLPDASTMSQGHAATQSATGTPPRERAPNTVHALTPCKGNVAR